MNIEAYKKLVDSELWMYDTSELLDESVVKIFDNHFIIDKSMTCSNCKHYGSHCGTLGWCLYTVFPNDDGYAGYIKPPKNFCCNHWEQQ